MAPPLASEETIVVGSAALAWTAAEQRSCPREAYYAWWLERFGAEECEAMARAIDHLPRPVEVRAD